MNQSKKTAEIVKLSKENSHLAGLKLEDIYTVEGDRRLMTAITALDFAALTSLITGYDPKGPSSIPFLLLCELGQAVFDYGISTNLSKLSGKQQEKLIEHDIRNEAQLAVLLKSPSQRGFICTLLGLKVTDLDDIATDLTKRGHDAELAEEPEQPIAGCFFRGEEENNAK